MLVVHGVWLVGVGLALWAEESTAPARPPRRAGRPPRERPHPFAADHAALTDALGPAATSASRDSVALTLPTRGGAPLDSPELVRTAAVDPARGAVTLARWRVPILAYAPPDALAVLRRVDGYAAVPGAGLRHLAELAAFATDLVARGRVLPVVADDDRPGRGLTSTAVACWHPLLTGVDAGWARALTLALPPSARAAGPVVAARRTSPARRVTEGTRSAGGPSIRPGQGADGGPGPADVVADALDALTDAAARTALDGLRLPGTGRRDSVAAWSTALTGPRGGFTVDPADRAALRAGLEAWQRDAVGNPVRASFRLTEPPAPDLTLALDVELLPGDAHAPDIRTEPDGTVDPGTWRLEFGLQAADEPGLLVGAGPIWHDPESARVFADRVDAPQETLLAELGRASRLWPELDGALRTATPEALELDAEGAHRFLREGAPVLHAAGFGVLLPGWWHRPAARLGARLQARSRTAPGTVATAGGVGLDALVDYRWELALGDQPLTAEELVALAERKSPLVRLRGQWVELDPKRLATGLRLLRTSGELTVADLLRLGLADGDDAALPVLEINADGALGDLLSGQAERRLTPLDPPPGFIGELRPYQRRGLAWLAFLQSLGLGAVLADDMGLGKTVQLLALLAADPPEAGPTLLVCPMSLVGNWQREAARFTPKLRVHVHHGADRARGERFAEAVNDTDLMVTTYAVAARDAVALAGVDWHRVVVDEAQAIKNAATRQAEAVRALPARHRIAVTGTPVENRLADLWSIMQFANPGLLGPAATFRRRYAEPIERHGDEETAGRLRRVTGPFVLRRLKTDPSIISDLPEKLEMEVLCNLTAEQAALYQAVVDDMLAKIESSDGIERRGLVLATMTKLKQVCNHPAHLLRDGSALPGRSGKLARLEEILDEVLAAGEKALLFSQYAEFGGMLRGHLSARFGREVLFLHGGVGKADRDEMVTGFQSPDGPALFVLSLKAGGTGLTLTAANHVVHVDRWWNPAVEDQATDRAFRIGQRRRVQVRKFVCAGTVEEKVAAMITEKRGLAARVVGSGEQWLTELSTADLRDLFTLAPQAVAE
ncbi:non-specific serine/threonine protein kinase [Micromonospora inyonensis]|uniref:Non-specific serine/threonine protein kinase n=1 Tax=Micromonospora inyonensis TaxID=47866 RepID=A0A1C6S0A1_9ACTN|nr:DEAD/DEAH box helicase [Micromonospora inyonensis]SCL22881.1 non-specific serine/threonine protein kinase [Micromonospora inyonensis]